MNNFKNANIIEIFSSIQGEGPYVGYKQIFIRFASCNLDCQYCDTLFTEQESCKIYNNQELDDFYLIKNPVSIEELIFKIGKFLQIKHHSISLTGGEPLLNAEFLQNLLPELKNKFKLPVYLETNGTLPDKLEQIINQIDIISMDIKLQTSTNIETPWDQHKKFIETAQKFNKEIFAKAVITNKITQQEIFNIVQTIKNQKKEIPLIIQPVDLKGDASEPDSSFLMNTQQKLLKELEDVRIIPQIHKYLKVV